LLLLAKEYKDDLVRWMKVVLNYNISRRKTVPNVHQISSEGFFFNFLQLMLLFVKPIIERSETMLNKIKITDIPEYEYFNEIDSLAGN
jgi:hypothetical protein